jgi:hypothetical protein
MARKFKVGQRVIVVNDTDTDGVLNGEKGVVRGYADDGRVTVDLSLSRRYDDPIIPFQESELDDAGEVALRAFTAWGVSALVESLNSAKAHRDANRAKYASQAKMTVKFTPVPKGSEPIRVNTSSKSRQAYRLDTLFAHQRGFESWDAYEADYIVRGRKEVE